MAVSDKELLNDTLAYFDSKWPQIPSICGQVTSNNLRNLWLAAFLNEILAKQSETGHKPEMSHKPEVIILDLWGLTHAERKLLKIILRFLAALCMV